MLSVQIYANYHVSDTFDKISMQIIILLNSKVKVAVCV